MTETSLENPAVDPDCIFCQIVAGRIPAEIVHDSDKLIAFRDTSPKAPVHVLVVPRQHYRDVRELAFEPQLMSDVVRAAEEIALQEANGDFRLVFNTGASAGQSVFHVHAHVLAGEELAEGAL